MFIFSIYDKKAQQHMQPFVAPNYVTAMRSISAALKPTERDIPMRDYPHDFVLNCIGTFDSDTGSIEAYAMPLYVEELANLVQPK